METIRKKVIENDISRPYLTSSPSNGKETIKEGWLSNYPQDNRFGDVHFYYYGTNAWDWKIYPSTRFASEYGFQSLPSLKSLSKVVNSSDLRFPLSDAISQRQHHTNGNKEITALIQNYMKLPTSGGVDRLDDFIYLSQISQAMSLKTETEFYRRNRVVNQENGEGFTMGALYWQLNDIWPGPSWASIEFGGKWKMSHNFVKNVFEPFLVIPFVDNNHIKVALIRDDYNGALNFQITIRVWKWSAETPSFETTITATTSSLSSQTVYQELISKALLSGNCLNRNECLIEAIAENLPNNWRTNNFLLLSPIRDAIGIKNSIVRVKEMTGPHNQMPDYVFEITIECKSIALFVWLDFTLNSSISGHFSDNGFILFPNTKTVYFFCKTPLKIEDFKTQLIIKTLTDVKTD